MRVASILVALAIAAGASTGATAKTIREKGTTRERAEQACYNDATRLCNDAIPDEGKVTICMGKHRAELTPECRKVFDEGLEK